MRPAFILPLLLLWTNACHTYQGERNPKKEPAIAYRFDLMHPDTVYRLPAVLKEISGITAVNDSLVACIADEKGIVYFFHTATGRIIGHFRFGPDADYEDIASIGDTLYVLDSKGIIWTIRDFQKHPVIHSYSLPLTGSFELEALCVYQGALYTGAKYYHQQRSQPVWRLHPSSSMKLVFVLPDQLPLFRKAFTRFHLSGMAMDNSTGEWICISANKRVLARYTSDGVLFNAISLPASLFPQPEGICLTPTGQLLVSNEGKDGPATLLLFHSKMSK